MGTGTLRKKKCSISDEGLILYYIMRPSINKKSMNTPIEKGEKDVVNR